METVRSHRGSVFQLMQINEMTIRLTCHDTAQGAIESLGVRAEVPAERLRKGRKDMHGRKT
jgi:hypothetical protein